MRDSFVFYSSFIDTIETAPENIQLELYKAICYCGVGRKEAEEFQFPISLFVRQAMSSVDAAQKRYDKSVENGVKGGRPKKWIDQSEAEALFEQLGTWAAVAEKLDVSYPTLVRVRKIWDEKNEKNEKNLNKNVSDNKNVNELLSEDNNTKASDGTRLEAVPPPQGCEWSSKVVQSGNEHYRRSINKTTGETMVIRLD